jgi:hypothetical protein
MTTSNIDTNSKINRNHVGSSLEDLLNEAGIFEEVDESARREVEKIRNARLAHEALKAADREITIATFRIYHRRRIGNFSQRKAKLSPRNWFIKLG